MKTNFFKATILALVTIFTISCSKEESSSETNQTITPVINTWAKFTVATPSGVVKPNYIVMMFETPFSTTAPLPTIIKQATTDANGIANLDLNNVITSTTLKTYYFEAFVQTATGYELKTNYSRFSTDFKKGCNLTTGLFVN